VDRVGAGLAAGDLCGHLVGDRPAELAREAARDAVELAGGCCEKRRPVGLLEREAQDLDTVHVAVGGGHGLPVPHDPPVRRGLEAEALAGDGLRLRRRGTTASCKDEERQNAQDAKGAEVHMGRQKDTLLIRADSMRPYVERAMSDENL